MSLVAVFAVIKLVLSGSGPITRHAAMVGGACAAIQGVANALTPALLDTPQLNLLLPVRLLPSILIAAAIRIQELEVSADPAALTRRKTRPFSLLPYLAVAATHVLLLVILPRGLDARVWGVLVGVVTINALVVVRQLAAFTDITRLLGRLDASLLEIRLREQRFRSLVQHASEITTIVTADGTVTYASPGIERVLGLAPEDVVGRPGRYEIHPDDMHEVRRRISRLTRIPRASVTFQMRVRHADHSWRWLEVTSTNLLDDPSVQGVVSNARDVTEAREFQDRLRYQASHDALTRLANRSLFNERLSAAITGGRRSSEQIAVLLIDLDDFKSVNDTLGHHVGDDLLVTIARRLMSCVRPSDTVARLGGDEFAILLHGIAAEDTEHVVDRVMAAFEEPVVAHGHELRVQASLGVAAGQPDDPETLLRDADAAMYTAKKNGKGSFVYHQEAV
jgi:diguanylate cyclase (GGDEF)-like protein/PAS domain S-box-containing protein